MRFLPAAIVLVNNDLVPEVLQFLQVQLKITDTYVDGYAFDTVVAADPDYKNTVQRLNKRVLVLRNFQELNNRSIFDIVLFAYSGMVAIEQNNIGPHLGTFPIVNLTWGALGIY